MDAPDKKSRYRNFTTLRVLIWGSFIAIGAAIAVLYAISSFMIRGPQTLHRAVYDGNLSEVRRFIAAGADVSERAHKGWDLSDQVLFMTRGAGFFWRKGHTPLHIAALYLHTEVAKELIKAGADVNAKWGEDAAGGNAGYASMTPLATAVRCGNDELVATLIDAQANVNTTIYDGYTPLRIATAKGDKDIIRLLLTAGADPAGAQGPE